MTSRTWRLYLDTSAIGGCFDAVKLDKIKGYNQVNLLNGYGLLTIVSPKEVSFDE
jgi:hypothetical protein